MCISDLLWGHCVYIGHTVGLPWCHCGQIEHTVELLRAYWANCGVTEGILGIPWDNEKSILVYIFAHNCVVPCLSDFLS